MHIAAYAGLLMYLLRVNATLLLHISTKSLSNIFYDV